MGEINPFILYNYGMVDFDTMFKGFRQVKQFQTLSDEELKGILTSGRIFKFSAGEFIFIQDEPSSGMFVLIEGVVNLCKLGPQGQQNILATIKPIIMFNEVAVLDCGKNPVTAIATQDSILWRVDCEIFQSLLKRFPEIGLGLLRIMAIRNRRLVQHYEDLSYRNVESRVAKLLLDLSTNGSQPIQRKDHSIEEIASLTASVGPVVSRTINNFKQSGFITTSRKTILINHPEEIARIAAINLDFLD